MVKYLVVVWFTLNEPGLYIPCDDINEAEITGNWYIVFNDAYCVEIYTCHLEMALRKGNKDVQVVEEKGGKFSHRTKGKKDRT